MRVSFAAKAGDACNLLFRAAAMVALAVGGASCASSLGAPADAPAAGETDAAQDAATDALGDAALPTCNLPQPVDEFANFGHAAVSPDGSDDGDGINTPYATIAYAVAHATAPVVIDVAAGSYVVDAPIELPDGVVVRGAGRDSDGTWRTSILDSAHCAHNFFTLAPVTGNAALSGIVDLEITGCNNGLTASAIKSDGRDSMRFRGDHFVNFSDGAINITGGSAEQLDNEESAFIDDRWELHTEDYAHDLVIDDVEFENCGSMNGTSGEPALSIWGLYNAQLSRLRFTGPDTDRGVIAGRGWINVDVHDVVASNNNYYVIEVFLVANTEVYDVISRVGYSMYLNHGLSLHHTTAFRTDWTCVTPDSLRAFFEFGGDHSEIAFNHVENVQNGISMYSTNAGQDDDSIVHNTFVGVQRSGMLDLENCTLGAAPNGCDGHFGQLLIANNNVLNVATASVETPNVERYVAQVAAYAEQSALGGVSELQINNNVVAAGTGHFLQFKDDNHDLPASPRLHDISVASNFLYLAAGQAPDFSTVTASIPPTSIVFNADLDSATAPTMDCGDTAGLTLSCASVGENGGIADTSGVWIGATQPARGTVEAYENRRWPALDVASAPAIPGNVGSSYLVPLRGNSFPTTLPNHVRFHILARRPLTGARWQLELAAAIVGPPCVTATLDGTAISITTSVATRLQSDPVDVNYGWHTLEVSFGGDMPAINSVGFGDAIP